MRLKDVAFWVLFLLGVAAVVLLIFGKSSTLEQALLILILSLVVKNTADLRELKERVKNNERKFQALVADFKEHIKHS